MNTPENPFLPHGGYHYLRSYKVAQAVYDATVVFCRRFYAQDRRMSEQMVQAARSRVRNISEGSGAAATSSKSEMKLTNVARASLSDELLRDYESFLRQGGFQVWPKDSPKARAMRARLAQDEAPELPAAPAGVVRLSGLFGLSEFVDTAAPELVGNAMLCAVNQAAYLLKRQLESQGETFLAKGGFTERLYAARTGARGVDRPRAPRCPKCGKEMMLRTARRGANNGKQFWGCSGYPECKALLPVSSSDASDGSDKSD